MDGTQPRVGIYAGPGAARQALQRTCEALAAGAWGPPVPIEAEDFRPERLRDFAVVVLPGGRGNAICRDLGPAGRQALRDHAAGGGAVLGICAGMYALAGNFSWALDMVPVHVLDVQHWQRGRARLPVTLTPAGQMTFGGPASLSVSFLDGPVVGPDGSGTPFEVLATYDADLVHPGGTPGLMPGSPAATRASFGAGRVMGIGPHLEDLGEHQPLLANAVAALLDVAAGNPPGG